MLAGAAGVLITGQITPAEALKSIDFGVMVFLLSMFIIGAGFEASGLLEACIQWISCYAKNGDMLLALIIVCMGLLSAVFMNDTIAIIGTPVVLVLASRFEISKPEALLVLCFAITTGSVFSPIGNPQNYLIVSYAADISPYYLFLSGLLLPTMLSLGVIWVIMRPLFKNVVIYKEKNQLFDLSQYPFRKVMYLSLFVLFTRIGYKVLNGLTSFGVQIPFEWVSFAAAMPVLIFAPDRMNIIKKTDWRTLVFFAAMFILMHSVYDSGLFQHIIPEKSSPDVSGVMAAGIILSQFISNVPFVALFQPDLLSMGVSPSLVLALAAGSTIAGNLTILGAASNVIVIEQAGRSGVGISMKLFCKYGIPITLCQTVIYTVALTWYPV